MASCKLAPTEIKNGIVSLMFAKPPFPIKGRRAFPWPPRDVRAHLTSEIAP